MTVIQLEQISNRFYVTASGHACYSEYGKDIVCAAVSTLIQSFGFFCEDMQEESKCIVRHMVFNEVDGVYILVVEGDVNTLEPAYKMLKTGLEAIANNFPKNILLAGENN